MSQIICACGCGESFNRPDRTPNRIYKRGHGHRTDQPDLVDTVCHYCNKPFRLHPSRLVKFKHVYCSRKCASKAKIKRVTKPCFICGKPITRKPNRMISDKVFCSQKCFAKYVPVYRTSQVNTTCAGCNKPISVYRSAFKRNKRMFCSWECRNSHITGTNNPSYKNGRGSKFDYGPFWKSQRRKAIIRDQYTCQYCGKKPKHMHSLEVHHITPAHDFNGDYEHANQLTNLITLCIPCHKKAEKGLISIQRKLF